MFALKPPHWLCAVGTAVGTRVRFKSGIVFRDYGIVCRDSALVTESEVTAQSPPCAIFSLSLIPINKVFYSPDDVIATAAARFGEG